MSDDFRKTLETFANQFPDRRVHDRNRLPGVHVGLPEDGSAGLRHADDYLYSGGQMRRAEEPEAVLAEGSATRAYSTSTSTNRILDDLVATIEPREITLTAAFTPRGGITTTVTATFEAAR